MELVYLWVENYKNIHRQGFNFSPRFRCAYDPDSNELTIDENDDYIENFFGDDINVTAIVGKNGSGKSSILQYINELIQTYHLKNSDIHISSFFLFIRNEKFFFLKNQNIDIKLNMNLIDIETLDEYFNINTFSYFSEMPYNTFSFFNDSLSGDLLMTPIEFDKMIRDEYLDLSIERVGEILVTSKDDLYEVPGLNFKPIKVLLENNNNFTKVIKGSLGLYIARNINYNNFDNDTLNIIDEVIEYDFNSFEICLVDALIRNCEEEYITGYIYKLQEVGTWSAASNQFFIELYSYLKTNGFLNDVQYIKDLSISEYYKLLEKEFVLNSNSILIKFSHWKRLLTFDFIDSKGRKYTDLSYGEKVLFGQIINFQHRLKIEIEEQKNLFELEIGIEDGASYYKPIFLFLLDEPDISMHPQWQKQYLNILIETFKIFDIKINILLTTHSPFLLSDIPKQNIIFLDTDKKGNCKVVNGLKEKKETFGANIHTLLSDSFFMSDGLMGEFAKSKINEIIEFFDNKNELYSEDKVKLYQIINSIGEPFLKEKLLFMYNERFPKTKEEQIAEYKAEIERLEADDQD